MQPVSHKENRAGLTECLWLAALMAAPLDSVLLMEQTLLGFRLSAPRLVFAAAMALSMVSAVLRGRIRRPRAGLVLALFLVWLAWSAASALWAPDGQSALRHLLLLGYNGALVLVVAMNTSVPRHERFLKCMMLVVGAALLLGLTEAATGYRMPASRQWGFGDGVTSFFVNPIHFATVLVLFSPFALLRCVRPGVTPGRRLAWLAVLLALSYGVLLTGSRTGLACLALSVLVAGVLFLHSLSARLRWAGLAASVLGVSWLTLEQAMDSFAIGVPERLHDLAAPARLWVLSDRQILLQAGVDLWKQAPHFGWGLGSGEHLLGSYGWLADAGAFHNWWIEVLVTTGLLGAILFTALYVAALVRLLRLAWRRGGQDEGPSHVAAAFAAGLLLLMPLSLGPGSLLDLPLFWIYLGLAMSLPELPGDDGAAREARGPDDAASGPSGPVGRYGLASGTGAGPGRGACPEQDVPYVPW